MSQTALPDSLERTYLQKGWREVYLRHIPDLAYPNLSNEMYARCPWKDVTDNNASFSVNNGTGLFICFQTQRSGNYVNFRQYFDSDYYGPNGYLIPIDYNVMQQRLMEEEGIVPPTEEWIYQCHINLIQSSETIKWLQQFKPWMNYTLQYYQIGFDYEKNRIVIPIRDENGKLINAKMYSPTGQPKMHWLQSGLAGNFCFPNTVFNEDNLILVEGETDVLTLRSFGFNAVSGTISGSAPVPAGEWFRSRRVSILMDEDFTGERARQTAINTLSPLASEVRSILLPEWEGKQKGADITDYIQQMLRSNTSYENIVSEINNLISNAEIVSSQITQFDIPAVPITFNNILGSEHVNNRLEFNAKVVAKSEKRYIGVTRYFLNCPAKGHKFCNDCLLNKRYNGHAEFMVDRRSPQQLRMISVNEQERLFAVKKHVGIPSGCPSVNIDPFEWVGYEPIQLSTTIAIDGHESGNGTEDVENSERYRREGYYIFDNQFRLEENRDYRFTGFLYPEPKSQSGIMLLDSAEPLQTTTDLFKMDESIGNQLKIFQLVDGEYDYENVIDCINLLKDRGNDLINSVTGIKGRLDMHLAMSLVFHSPIEFYLGEKKINRGWLELFILGDTRSGKSVAFKSLSSFYGIGQLVDCKNQTTAGLLGSVNTSNATGERYVTAGLLPQNNKGIVCLDEMEGARLGRVTMLEALASMRSEGIVRITKAASAQYEARVRLICMANPGKGKLISETGKTGAQLINEMIPQPENIARFDAALCVGQNDVTSEEINSSVGLEKPKYGKKEQQLLLVWIHSRKANQIVFTPEAEMGVAGAAEAMCQKYDPSLPLVEPSDQRTRIAKWSVAIAGFCFSTDETFENIIVKPYHVRTAWNLLTLFYDKPIMGYDVYSKIKQEERSLQNEKAIRDAFALLGANCYNVARYILTHDELSDRAFRNIVNGPAATNVLNILISNNCLRQVFSGRRDSYEKTTMFIKWLENYIEEGKGASQ